MSQENVEILRRVFQQWASGDLSGTEVFDPDVEYSRIGAETPDMEGRWLGLDEMRMAMRDYLQPMSNMRVEAERIIDLGGDRVLVLSRHTAHGKQSGVPIERKGGELFTLRDGKIVRYDAYWSRAAALEAVGLSEEAMSQENVEVVRQGIARWRAGDDDALLDFLVSNSAEDVELHSRFAGFSGEPYRGHDGLRAWLADIRDNFDRFDPWIDEARVAGEDRVLALGGIRFRARESGIDMAEQMGWVFEFTTGRLRRMMFYGSSREALEAVGLLKEHGG